LESKSLIFLGGVKKRHHKNKPNSKITNLFFNEENRKFVRKLFYSRQ